jgi:hypothetical protein
MPSFAFALLSRHAGEVVKELFMVSDVLARRIRAPIIHARSLKNKPPIGGKYQRSCLAQSCPADGHAAAIFLLAPRMLAYYLQRSAYLSLQGLANSLKWLSSSGVKLPLIVPAS